MTYNPSQPRDQDGKWVSHGSGVTSKLTSGAGGYNVTVRFGGKKPLGASHDLFTKSKSEAAAYQARLSAFHRPVTNEDRAKWAKSEKRSKQREARRLKDFEKNVYPYMPKGYED